MSSDALGLAKKIVRFVKSNYETSEVEGVSFHDLQDEGLSSFFEENNIFYQSYLLANSKGLINSTYLGNIVGKEGNVYVCSLHGIVSGVDFYESYIKANPTIIRELPTGLKNDFNHRLLIHKDGITDFFENNNFNKDANSYINEIIKQGHTINLKPSINEIKHYLRTQ